MSRFLVLLWVLLLASPLHAESSDSVPLTPQHQGYVFDKPRLLVQQRLFGLAHGVTVLATACAREPDYRENITAAYAEWYRQQTTTIDTVRRNLSIYYFGDHAAEASKQDIATALKLKPQLDLKPGSKTFSAACDTLAETLHKSNYDLRQLQFLTSRLAAAITTTKKTQACRTLLSSEQQVSLDDAMVQWRKSYGPDIDEARITLQQRWPDAQFRNLLDDWYAQTKSVTPAKLANSASNGENVKIFCATLPTWLLTKQANPDDQFNSKP